MPTLAEARRRRAQSKKDKARNRIQRDRDLGLSFTAFNSFTRDIEITAPAQNDKEIKAIMPPTTDLPNLNFVSKMFNKQDYSDVTIFIHGTKLYAHRFVICVQSRYFAKAFQDKVFAEGCEGEIRFDEGSAMAHWRVFEYLYTGDYTDDLKIEGLRDDPAMLKDPRVYALADMFFLKDLKVLALTKMKHRLKVGWQSKSFPICVEEIYAITRSSCSMRLAVAQIAAEHGKDLQKEEAFLDLLHKGGDFVVDFYKALRIW